MFCSNCGSPLGDSTKFCAKCGAPRSASVQVAAPQTPPPPVVRRKSNKGARWLAVLFAVVAVWFVFSRIDTSPSPSSTAASNGTPNTPAPAAATYKIGDSITAGYWSYRVYSAQWKNSIGGEYMNQTPDATFLVVDLAIRNNDKTASTLPPLKLVDAEGREHDESDKRWAQENNFGPLKSLNPTVVSRGYAVFDVPKGQYSLKVSGGFSSSASGLIELHK
jgi:hypothetical protein